MIDKVIYFLSEEFRKEGLLVPFGTTYRIAENLITKQNECSKELVCCKDCIYFDPKKALRPGGIWCEYWGIDPDPEDWCCKGERKAND